jgi:hypothetical protein
MPRDRKTNAAVRTGGNQPLLSSFKATYGETECPPKKFIRVYYFFRGKTGKAKSK